MMLEATGLVILAALMAWGTLHLADPVRRPFTGPALVGAVACRTLSIVLLVRVAAVLW